MLRRPILRLSLLAWLVQAASSQVLLAGTGLTTTLPSSTRNAKSGLLMTIDTRWVDGNGYRPVRVHLTNWPPRPAPADRLIEVELRTHNWNTSQFEIAVRTAIEIPEGGMGAVQTVSTPQWQEWGFLGVETWEDGKKLDELSDTITVGGNGTGLPSYSEGVPSILIVDCAARSRRPSPLVGPSANQSSGGAAADIGGLLKFLPGQDGTGAAQGQNGGATPPPTLETTPTVEVLSPDDLPSRWIDYTCFDLVFLSFGDLKVLTSSHPEPWRAIRDWAASGPALCVYDAGERFERLAELEQLLELSPLSDDGKEAPAFRGWTAPNPKHYQKNVAVFEKYEQASRSWYGVNAAETARRR